MGRRHCYSDSVVNQARCPSDMYLTQPEGRSVGVILTEQKMGAGNLPGEKCQPGGALRGYR